MAYTTNFTKRTHVVYEIDDGEPTISPTVDYPAYEAQLQKRYRFVWLYGFWKPNAIKNWVKNRGEKVKRLKASHVYFNTGRGGCEAVPVSLEEAA